MQKLLSDIWLILARVTAGVIFIPSGIKKLSDTAAAAENFASLGVPQPSFTATFTGWVELIAGIALIIGVLTRLAAFLLAGTMAVALIVSQAAAATANSEGIVRTVADFFFSGEWLLMVVLIGLMAFGSGMGGVDRLVATRTRGSS